MITATSTITVKSVSPSGVLFPPCATQVVLIRADFSLDDLARSVREAVQSDKSYLGSHTHVILGILNFSKSLPESFLQKQNQKKRQRLFDGNFFRFCIMFQFVCPFSLVFSGYLKTLKQRTRASS